MTVAPPSPAPHRVSPGVSDHCIVPLAAEVGAALWKRPWASGAKSSSHRRPEVRKCAAFSSANNKVIGIREFPAYLADLTEIDNVSIFTKLAGNLISAPTDRPV